MFTAFKQAVFYSLKNIKQIIKFWVCRTWGLKKTEGKFINLSPQKSQNLRTTRALDPWPNGPQPATWTTKSSEMVPVWWYGHDSPECGGNNNIWAKHILAYWLTVIYLPLFIIFHPQRSAGQPGQPHGGQRSLWADVTRSVYILSGPWTCRCQPTASPPPL